MCTFPTVPVISTGSTTSTSRARMANAKRAWIFRLRRPATIAVPFSWHQGYHSTIADPQCKLQTARRCGYTSCGDVTGGNVWQLSFSSFYTSARWASCCVTYGISRASGYVKQRTPLATWHCLFSIIGDQWSFNVRRLWRSYPAVCLFRTSHISGLQTGWIGGTFDARDWLRLRMSVAFSSNVRG